MSSVAEGWYLDPSTGTNLRFWSGSTWTDEVAPLPADSPPLGLFADEAAETAATAEPATTAETAEDAGTATAVDVTLESDLEHTQLTRRELRARRGDDPAVNDAPKHLPPIAPPPAAPTPPAEPAAEQPEDDELEILPAPMAVEDEKDPSLRHRIVRMTVLLGILTVVSTVGVLTAGSL